VARRSYIRMRYCQKGPFVHDFQKSGAEGCRLKHSVASFYRIKMSASCAPTNQRVASGKKGSFPCDAHQVPGPVSLPGCLAPCSQGWVSPWPDAEPRCAAGRICLRASPGAHAHPPLLSMARPRPSSYSPHGLDGGAVSAGSTQRRRPTSVMTNDGKNLRVEKDKWDVNRDGTIDLDEWARVCRSVPNGAATASGEPAGEACLESWWRSACPGSRPGSAPAASRSGTACSGTRSRFRGSRRHRGPASVQGRQLFKQVTQQNKLLPSNIPAWFKDYDVNGGRSGRPVRVEEQGGQRRGIPEVRPQRGRLHQRRGVDPLRPVRDGHDSASGAGRHPAGGRRVLLFRGDRDRWRRRLGQTFTPSIRRSRGKRSTAACCGSVRRPSSR